MKIQDQRVFDHNEQFSANPKNWRKVIEKSKMAKIMVYPKLRGGVVSKQYIDRRFFLTLFLTHGRGGGGGG